MSNPTGSALAAPVEDGRGEWAEIARRAQEATGPDRELDLAAFRVLHPEFDGYVEGRGGLVHPCDSTDQRVISDVRWPRYTGSVDAMLALIAEKLPGWRTAELRELIEMRGGRFRTAAWSADLQEINGAGYAEAEAATPALALLAAFALAMEASHGH